MDTTVAPFAAQSDPVSQLVTASAVPLDLRPAQIPARLRSVGIDLGLMFGATCLYGYGIVDRVGGSAARVRAVTIAGALLINFGYLIAMQTLTRGRTVGALALGLRVVRDDGGAIRFRQALLSGRARSSGLWGYPRDHLANDLARQVAAHRSCAADPTAPLEFLVAVVAERRRRERSRMIHQQWVPAAEELPGRLAVTARRRSSTLRAWTPGLIGR